MKPFLLGLLIFCSFSLFSQTKGSAKLYGFKEPVASGKHPDNEVEENGNKSTPVSTGSQSFNYFIYLQSPVRVYPAEMWLNGSVYAVSIQTVTTPVERDNGTTGGKKKLLVPKTTNKVLLLTPVPLAESKNSTNGKALAAKNELVVIYKQGGRFYYSVVKTLTVLETVPLQ